MTDYNNMSIKAIFDSFDKNQNGIIDKKEVKENKSIFILQKGMTLDSFKSINKQNLINKDIHSTLINGLDSELFKDSDFSSKPGCIRVAIRSASTYLSLTGNKLKFEDLMPYIERSDRIENLKEAFGFIDNFDSFEKTDEGPRRKLPADGILDTSELMVDGFLDWTLLGGSRETISKHSFINEQIKALKDNGKNPNFTAEDVETILLSIYYKCQDIKK